MSTIKNKWVEKTKKLKEVKAAESPVKDDFKHQTRKIKPHNPTLKVTFNHSSGGIRK